MREHNQPVTGKMRVLIFDPGVVLSGWNWKDPKDPACRDVVGDWEWNEKEGLVLPKRFRPKDDTGWRGNLVVSTGRNLYQNQTFGITSTPVDNTGVGSSGTAPAPGNVSLTGAVFQAFDALPVLTAFVIAAQSTYAGGSTAIQWNEAGCFAGAVNASPHMLNRIVGFGSPTPGGSAAIAAWSITQN